MISTIATRLYWRQKLWVCVVNRQFTFAHSLLRLDFSFQISLFSIELLDNKQINDVTRLFLKNFDKVKSEQKQKKSTADVGPCVDGNGATNNTVDIDLRNDNGQSAAHPDPMAIDVGRIISQAIVENVQGQPAMPWLIFGGCTFLTEYIAATPKPILDKNEQDSK